MVYNADKVVYDMAKEIKRLTNNVNILKRQVKSLDEAEESRFEKNREFERSKLDAIKEQKLSIKKKTLAAGGFGMMSKMGGGGMNMAKGGFGFMKKGVNKMSSK